MSSPLEHHKIAADAIRLLQQKRWNKAQSEKNQRAFERYLETRTPIPPFSTRLEPHDSEIDSLDADLEQQKHQRQTQVTLAKLACVMTTLLSDHGRPIPFKSDLVNEGMKRRDIRRIENGAVVDTYIGGDRVPRETFSVVRTEYNHNKTMFEFSATFKSPNLAKRTGKPAAQDAKKNHHPDQQAQEATVFFGTNYTRHEDKRKFVRRVYDHRNPKVDKNITTAINILMKRLGVTQQDLDEMILPATQEHNTREQVQNAPAINEVVIPEDDLARMQILDPVQDGPTEAPTLQEDLATAHDKLSNAIRNRNSQRGAQSKQAPDQGTQLTTDLTSSDGTQITWFTLYPTGVIKVDHAKETSQPDKPTAQLTTSTLRQDLNGSNPVYVLTVSDENTGESTTVSSADTELTAEQQLAGDNFITTIYPLLIPQTHASKDQGATLPGNYSAALTSAGKVSDGDGLQERLPERLNETEELTIRAKIEYYQTNIARVMKNRPKTEDGKYHRFTLKRTDAQGSAERSVSFDPVTEYIVIEISSNITKDGIKTFQSMTMELSKHFSFVSTMAENVVDISSQEKLEASQSTWTVMPQVPIKPDSNHQAFSMDMLEDIYTSIASQE